MKAQTTKQPLVPLSLFSATESLAAAVAQATEPEQADTAPMAVDTGAGCRTPSMSNRFDAQGQSSSGDLDDEFLILMSLDGEMMTEVPVDPLCDAMRGHEAGQHRPGLNWPPLASGYPVLVVPAERLEAIWSAKNNGLLMPAQHGLSGQGLDAPLRVHCIASPIIPEPSVTPAPTIPPTEPVIRNVVSAARVFDDYDFAPVTGEENHVGASVSSKFAAQLLICRNALAASGSFVMQDLIDLLVENGGVRRSHFLGGEVARIDITRQLMELLGDMVAMHGTPQARFDQASLAGFGLSVLQWCARSSYALSRLASGQCYSADMPNLVDENVINIIVLQTICGSEKMRNFMLGIFSEMETEHRELFKLSTKIKILRQWAAGEIVLSAAELRALCVLKLGSNASADRLLFLIRRHAGQLSLAAMNQHDQQGANPGLVTQ